MLNVEKYKDEILKYAGYQHSLMCLIYENIMKKNDCTGCCSKCKRETIKWLTSEYKEPILTDEEKEYLKNLIKHFRNYIKYIERETEDFYNGEQLESINIWMEKGDIGNFTIIPIVETSLTFEGMEDERQYSLEELGL